MTNPYRAICAELVDALDAGIPAGRIRMSPLADRARALLAEPRIISRDRDETGPYVVVAQPEPEGPTIGDVMQLWASTPHIDEAEGAIAFARAVLARWGRPAAAPVPEPVEVAGIAEWLNKRGQMADLGTRDWYFRAATLLQQQDAPAPVTVPVPVSERLPGPEDCDDQGRCWMFGKVEGDWRLISRIDPGIPKLRYCFSHWLPANALPLPAPEGGEPPQ